MSPEDELELETLRRDVETLGGDPESVLLRAQADAAPRAAGAPQFRDVGTYNYDYLDPSAQGAAPGPQRGPMADELRGLPGVVKPGPDGFDRVDPARLSLTNASATGELAREVEALRGEVAALGGNPDAVLSRVNKPTTPKPRQGRTQVADVGFGDVTTEADTGYDRTTLEGAGAFNRDFMQREAEQRRIAAARDMYQQARENGFDVPPLATERPRVRQPQDFDERQADELRAMAAYGTTDAERQANIKRELDAATMIGDDAGVARYRPSAGGFAHQMNVDPETGRTIGNISEDEVRRALRRREELFL